MADDIAARVWHDGSAAVPCPPLDATVDTDTAVIGGGYTGLAAALELRAAGREVTVLEAHEPGWGASGRNTGWWITLWFTKTPSQLAAQMGAERARRLTAMMVEAERNMPAMARDLGIECHLKATGVLMAAAKDKTFDKLKHVADDWNRAGHTLEVMERATTRALIATDRYVGAVKFCHAGMLDPLALCRGLARAAIRSGAAVHGRTPALALTRHNDRWRIKTPQGEVRAAHVIIATDAYRTNLWPGLDKTFYRIPLAMVSTTPFPDGGRSILPGGIPFSDADALDNFGAGFDDQGRLTMSIMPSFHQRRSKEAVFGPYWAMFRRVFPKAPGHITASHVWYGDVGVTPDFFPRLYAPAPGLVAINGYSGNGITQATAMGREAAKFIMGGAEACALPVSPLKPLPLTAAVSAGLAHVALPLLRQMVYRFS